ncbi:MAG TPA: TonB-dependent receptor, partial [Blastocatellia bacterium]|nr:TonB-dependent receptor [Blastocatellia bacterium]
LEAVKEFQVVPSGASAEFGRTAGGVINVITKSGTNEFHGSLFHYQRLEALTANTSDGKPLTDFHREQFGGTVGGPIVKDKMFFFGAFEQIFENLTRANLSTPIGAPCPVSAPTITANESLIAGSPDCQRLALINFFKTSRNQDEGLPVQHPIRNSSALGKFDWNVSPANKVGVSYSFDYSRNENQTFDVPTYGDSANGIEGPSKIQVVNLNLFSTLSANMVNEGHFTYSRESRPREATPSNVPADTAMGFGTTFRFGNPFFLAPNVDELIWRAQVKDNLSIIHGRHTVKIGGEWLHTRNSQVFRGFFEGRYIFDSVTGFLHYASPASLGSSFGPNVGECGNGSFTNLNSPSCAGAFSPLLLYLQAAGLNGPATDAAGFSDIANENVAAFAQDKWQVRPNFTLDYGLRWEAQTFPSPVIPPSQTAYGAFLGNPAFPSDGKLHSQYKMFQPRVGFAWDMANNGKSVLRANWGIYNANQNMLSQVGSITTNGVQQQTISGRPTWPGLLSVTPVPAGTFPNGSGVRVFSKDYANPRIYTTNVAFEQQVHPGWAVYADFTLSKGVHLTRFIENINTGPVVVPQNGDTVQYTGTSPFAPQLGSLFVTSSNGKSLYRGLTVGMKKRFSHGFQMELNYVYSKDMDDDSNERDPFTDRTFNRFDLSKDYALSDRDERHKFNFYTYSELPWGLVAAVRMQAHSAQPITDNPVFNPSGAPCSATNSNTRVVNGVDCGRNHLRKDNQYFSLDWRLLRPFKFNDRMALTPAIEMFNTFNNANNVNPLSTPALFNFDGFLRQGVGDPRQVQLSVKFTF